MKESRCVIGHIVIVIGISIFKRKRPGTNRYSPRISMLRHDKIGKREEGTREIEDIENGGGEDGVGYEVMVCGEEGEDVGAVGH